MVVGKRLTVVDADWEVGDGVMVDILSVYDYIRCMYMFCTMKNCSLAVLESALISASGMQSVAKRMNKVYNDQVQSEKAKM